MPVPLGFDARFQLMHEDDAIDALILATTGPAVGIVNVAGDGFLTVTQCTAIARRPVLPVPLSAVACSAPSSSAAGSPTSPPTSYPAGLRSRPRHHADA